MSKSRKNKSSQSPKQVPKRASEKAMRESTSKKGPKLSPNTHGTENNPKQVDESKIAAIDVAAADKPEKIIDPKIAVILAKPPTELTVKELRILIKYKEGDKIAANAAERGKNKLAKMRTYAIRQRAWADRQTEKAEASEKKATTAEAKLTEYEVKIGVEELTDEEIDKVLKELMSQGRVAQISIKKILEPHEDDQAATTVIS